MKNKILSIIFIITLSLIAKPISADAQQYAAWFTFQCISNNNPTDCAIGENQLRLEISDMWSAPYDIRFTFINTGPEASSITDIYFDDPTILSAGTSLLDYNNVKISPKTKDVAFSPNATPPNLPAGQDAPITFSADYSADSDSPVAKRGVNPGESIDFKFNYSDFFKDEIRPESPYAHPIYDLFDAIASGSFSIGLHIQAFGSQGSESFVLNLVGEGPTPIPEPATILLLGTGLAGAIGATRRKRKHPKI